MKRFIWLRFNMKVIYYFCILFSLLVIFLVYPSIISGKIKSTEAIWLIGVIIFMNSIGTVLYLYWMKLIIYIKINGKSVRFYDLNKREYTVSFNEIKRVVFTSDKYVFEIFESRKLFAYRKIWMPYVEKDGVMHRDILLTDFVGVRIDEDYSHII